MLIRIVPLAVMTAAALVLGGCVHRPSHSQVDELVSVEWYPLAIHFDNDARKRVHVYLAGNQREWLLGRVEPAARATLAIPEAALTEGPGFVQLVVLEGERLTLQAARNPRAVLSIAQPASSIVLQRWAFAHDQLTSFQVDGTPVDVGRE